MHRFVDFINTASEKLAAELISPDAIFYVPGRFEPMRGPSGYLAIIGVMPLIWAEGCPRAMARLRAELRNPRLRL